MIQIAKTAASLARLGKFRRGKFESVFTVGDAIPTEALLLCCALSSTLYLSISVLKTRLLHHVVCTRFQCIAQISLYSPQLL